MLEQIRKHVHGWMSWLFLFCIATVFILWGSVGLRLGVSKHIEINGQKIYPYQLEAFKQLFPGADLVQILISIQELEKAGFTISKDQVENIIKSMPEFQQKGKFSPEIFSKVLSHNPQQVEMLRTVAKFNNLSEQMMFALQQAHTDFPDNTSRYFMLMDQRRTISAINIEKDKFLNNINVTNKELENFYNTHKDNFVELPKVKLEYIKLSYQDIAKNINPTEAQIQDYYNNNGDLFVTTGKKRISQIVINNTSPDSKIKLEDVVKQLEADKTNQNNNTFGQLAQKYSDDFLTSKQQGDAGWMQTGDMNDKALDGAIASLNKIGDISQVITKDDKSYIFKLTDLEAKKKLALKDSKEQIIAKVREEQANSTFTDLKDQLERKSFEIADNLGVVASELKLTTNKSDWVYKTPSKADKKSDSSFEHNLITNPKVLAAAFSEDVLENHNNSNLIEITPDIVVVVRVTEYKPQSIRPINEVIPQLTEQVKNLKAKELAKKQAQDLWTQFIFKAKTNPNSFEVLEQLTQNNNYVKFSKPMEISFLDTFWDTKTDIPYAREVLKEGFVLPKPDQQNPVSAKLMELNNGDQAIIAINKVTLGKYDEANNEQKQQIANQLKYFMIMADNVNFFSRVIKESKVQQEM